jgi:tetratricopeptide (TPR) repeat protein
MKADRPSIENPQDDVPNLLLYHDVPPSPSSCKRSACFHIEDNRQNLPVLIEENPFCCHFFHHVTGISRFIAMAIRGFPPLDTPKMSSQQFWQHLNQIAQTIERVCTIHSGIWKQIHQDSFECIFPVKNKRDGEILLEKLKAELPQSNDTPLICIGTAWYPTLNFHRCQILNNAEKALEHASLLGPGHTVTFDAVSLNISGDHYYQSGNYQRAQKEFQLALQLDPLNVNIHNSLGVCHGMSGSPEKALETFETVLWLNPDEVMALHNAGIIYQIKGDYHKAIDLLNQAFLLDPTIFENAFHAGILSLKINKPRRATDYLQKAVQLDPKKAIAWRFLGDSYEKCGIHDCAIRAYKQAIRCNPEDAAALSALGYLYYKNNKNLEIAAVFCHESILLEPENAIYRQRLGKIYMKQNNDNAALLEFRRAQALGLDSEQWIEQIELYSRKSLAEK